MRSRLLLALFAVPVLCAAISDTAAAQSRNYRYRDNGRAYRYRDDGRTYVYRTDRMGRSIDRGYRSRIYMPSYRYKEPVVRSRTVVSQNDRSRATWLKCRTCTSGDRFSVFPWTSSARDLV